MTRKFNNGDWSEGRFKGFVVGLLRAGSRKWPPRYKTLDKAFQGQQLNPKTNRMAAHYKCAMCECNYPIKEVQVDHKRPVVPPEGFKTWDDYIDKLFCEESNLQVLCIPCHKKKTKAETVKRTEKRKR